MIRLIPAVVLVFFLWTAPVWADDSPSFLEQAEAHFTKGEFAKAARQAEKALKSEPDSLKAGVLLAESYNESKKYLKAISVYQDLIKKHPDNMDLVFSLGIVYNNAEYHANAVTAYQQVVAAQPDNMKAHHRLGVSHALCMDLSKAYDVYRFLRKHDEKLANDLLDYIQSNR